MKYCIYCGKQIDDSSIFCIYCGKKVIIGNTSRVEETREEKVEKTAPAEPVIAAPIPEPEKEPVEEKVDEPVEEKVEQPVERTEAEPDVSTAGAEQAKPEPEEEPIYYDEDYSDNTWKWILGIIVVALIGGGIWYFGFHGKTAPASMTDSDSVATDSVAAGPGEQTDSPTVTSSHKYASLDDFAANYGEMPGSFLMEGHTGKITDARFYVWFSDRLEGAFSGTYNGERCLGDMEITQEQDGNTQAIWHITLVNNLVDEEVLDKMELKLSCMHGVYELFESNRECELNAEVYGGSCGELEDYDQNVKDNWLE